MSANRLFFILISLALIFQCTAQSADGWKEEQGVYEQVHDAPLRLINGRETSIRQLARDRPVVLALIFTRCAGVCNPFMLRLKRQLKLIKEDPGFQLIVLSFDPRDRMADMQAYAKRFGMVGEANWYFAVTSEISSLNQSIGFNPVWDSSRQQYDHDALLVGINSQSYITKKLLGLRDYGDLTQLAASIHNEFSPTYQLPGQNLLFSCFNYNPRTGKSKPGLGLLFIALPAVLAFMLLLVIRLMVSKT
ncbi:MAG: SCO family protein [Cyclobacteriaceae bacterium]